MRLPRAISMGNTAAILLTALAPFSSGCLFYSVRAEIPSSHRADLQGVRRVAVETSNGKVRIACHPGAEGLRVAAVRFARGETEEVARTHAEAVTLEVGRDPFEADILNVKATVPGGSWLQSAGANFDLEMPPGADIDVRTSNGRVSVAGARGDARIRTSNGEVEVTDLEGDLDARSSNGGIHLRDIEGGTITAVTSNGEIHATELAGEPNLRTSNGPITLNLLQAPTRPLVKAQTSNASIRLEVPPGVCAELRLRTSNGSVSKDLQGFRVAELESFRNGVSAILNGGGGRIEAVTSNGAIDFRPSQ